MEIYRPANVIEYTPNHFVKTISPLALTKNINKAKTFQDDELNSAIDQLPIKTVNIEKVRVYVETNYKVVPLFRKRDYVLVDLLLSARHNKLVYRGVYTQTDGTRLYGGATDSVLLCEKYTKGELLDYEIWREGCSLEGEAIGINILDLHHIIKRFDEKEKEYEYHY